jgi:hypothetical protein
MAREDDVHRPPYANGALELSTVTPDCATVFGSSELVVHSGGEERSLHLI